MSDAPETRPPAADDSKPEWPKCEACIFCSEYECRRHAPTPVPDRRVWKAKDRIDRIDVHSVDTKRPDGTIRRFMCPDYSDELNLFPCIVEDKHWCGEWRTWDGEDFVTRMLVIDEWLGAHPGEGITC